MDNTETKTDDMDVGVFDIPEVSRLALLPSSTYVKQAQTKNWFAQLFFYLT